MTATSKPLPYRTLPSAVWNAAKHGQYVKASWLQARHYARQSARTIATLTVHRDFDFSNLNRNY